MIIYLPEVIYGRQKNLSQFQYNFKFYLKLATRLAGLKHRITHSERLFLFLFRYLHVDLNPVRISKGKISRYTRKQSQVSNPAHP